MSPPPLLVRGHDWTCCILRAQNSLWRWWGSRPTRMARNGSRPGTCKRHASPHEPLGTREARERPAHGGPTAEVQKVLCLDRCGLGLGFGVPHDPLGLSIVSPLALPLYHLSPRRPTIPRQQLPRQPQRHMQVVGRAHVAERVEAHRPERQFGRQVPPFGPVDGAKIQRVENPSSWRKCSDDSLAGSPARP